MLRNRNLKSLEWAECYRPGGQGRGLKSSSSMKKGEGFSRKNREGSRTNRVLESRRDSYRVNRDPLRIIGGWPRFQVRNAARKRKGTRVRVPGFGNEVSGEAWGVAKLPEAL